MAQRNNTQTDLWQFTINNPTQADHDRIKIEHQYHKCSSYHYTEEKGAEKETPHLQGVILMPTRVRRTAVSKIVPRGYIQPCDSVIGAITYNLKWENFPNPKTYHAGRFRMTRKDVKICKKHAGKECKVSDVWKEFIRLRHTPRGWTMSDFITHYAMTRDAPANEDQRLNATWLDMAYKAALKEGRTPREFRDAAQLGEYYEKYREKYVNEADETQDVYSQYTEDSQEMDI